MGHNPLADAASPDGYIFKFDTRDEEERQRIAAAFRDELAVAADQYVAPEDFRRLFRVRVFNMAKDRSARAVMKLEVYGQLAPHVHGMKPSWSRWLDEVHAKAYIRWHETDGLLQLRRFMVDADGGQQATPYGKKTAGQGAKGDGKGLRIGSRKSDFHAVFYQRTNQLTGCEVRVQDTPVRKAAAVALETALLVDLRDESFWTLLFQRIARVGEERLRRDFQLKGSDLARFVVGWQRDKYAKALSFQHPGPVIWEDEARRAAEDGDAYEQYTSGQWSATIDSEPQSDGAGSDAEGVS